MKENKVTSQTLPSQVIFNCCKEHFLIEEIIAEDPKFMKGMVSKILVNLDGEEYLLRLRKQQSAATLCVLKPSKKAKSKKSEDRLMLTLYSYGSEIPCEHKFCVHYGRVIGIDEKWPPTTVFNILMRAVKGMSVEIPNPVNYPASQVA